jgi:YD repeat-containing protein
MKTHISFIQSYQRKYNLRFLALFTILILGVNATTFAQDPSSLGDFPQQLNINSPQASDFIKYGNIQSTKQNGTINLSIPIASVGAGEFSESVSLGYNSSGFMPAKRGGIVGLNWYLNVGGAITRSVRGVPDEHKGNPSNGSGQLNGLFYGITKYSSSMTESDVFNFASTTGTAGSFNSWRRHLQGASNNQFFESQPDLFSFNFHGISGTFFFNNQGGVEVIPNQQVNIEVDLTNFALQEDNTKSIPAPSEIIFKLDNGYTYYFGGNTENVEFTVPIDSPLSPNSFTYAVPSAVINTWNLTKVVSPSGKEMIYVYDSDGIMKNSQGFIEDQFTQFPLGGNYNELLEANFNGLFRPIVLNKYVNQYRQFTNTYSHFFGSNLLTIGGGAASLLPQYEILKQSYLKSITTDNFQITFGYSVKNNQFLNDPVSVGNSENSGTRLYNFKDKQLDVITVRDYGIPVSTIKTFSLDYVYYGNRMFLNSIAEAGKPPHSFEYYRTNNLPSADTHGVDHWGFWTGGYSDTSELIPLIASNVITGDRVYTDPGNNDYRAPNGFCDVGLLSKVTYPTLGYSEFIYEPHYYSKRLDRTSANSFRPSLETMTSDIRAGGARIKQIKDFDGVQTTNIRDFYYTKNYSPTNTNGASSGLLMNWPRYSFYVNFIKDGVTTEMFRSKSSSFNRNTYDNFHIGYSEVTEVSSNGAYSTSYFSTYETQPDIDDIAGVSQWKELDVEPLISSNTFDNITPLSLFKNYVGQQLNDTSIERGKLLGVKNYTDIGNIVSESSFIYNADPNRFDNYVTQIHVSGGYWIQANKKYTYPNFVTQEKTKTYSQSNILSDFVEQITDKQYNYQYNKLISKQTTSSDGSTLLTQYKYPFDLYCNTTGSAYKYWQMTNANLLSFPVEVINKNDNIVTSAVVNDYGFAGNRVYLNETKTYSRTDLNTPYNPLTIDGLCNLVEDPNLESIIVYDTYDNVGNIQQLHKADGNPVVAIWGYNKTRVIAKIENVAYNDISSLITTLNLQTLSDNDDDTTIDILNTNGTITYVGNEGALREALESLRNNALLANAMVTSYTYDPLIGITSVTDPNGYTTYYEYDNSQRLKQVKDADGNILSSNDYHYNGQ